jgi:hypothetical protein
MAELVKGAMKTNEDRVKEAVDAVNSNHAK